MTSKALSKNELLVENIYSFVLEKRVTYSTDIVDQDGLWKKVIGEAFEDFLLFFAPKLHKEVDFSKAPDFLQQELFQEVMKTKKGTTHADQIVKVHLKNGEEQWILIHIEVEGSADVNFPKRMFKYFYRIYDKYDREIVTFAVLTDMKNRKEPSTFNYSYFGTTLDYAYNTCKISDYDDEELMRSDRLFSKVVLAAKYMHKTKNKMGQRYGFKMKLMRELLKMEGHSRASISAIFYFIDYLLRLPEDLTQELIGEIGPILEEERKHMVQLESGDLSPTLAELAAIEWKKAQEIGEVQGREQGREEGIEQGIEVGRSEGEERSKKNIALTLLGEDFEVDYIAKLTNLSVEEVEKLKATLM